MEPHHIPDGCGQNGLGYDYDFPKDWTVVRDWRRDIPFLSVKNQQDTSQCWNFSFTEFLSISHHLQKGNYLHLAKNELRDWVPYIQSVFQTSHRPTAHSVLPSLWPAFDRYNGCGAYLMTLFRYARTYGIHLEGNYMPGQRCDVLYGNNTNFFSMKTFFKMKEVQGVHRMFIENFEILDFNQVNKAMEIVWKNHPVIGNLYSSYDEFGDYDGTTPLSLYLDPSGRPFTGDHMVYILGIGSVKNEPCYLVKNSWGEGWGWGGYAMVPVQLFSEVGYPGDVHTRPSHVLVPDGR